MTCPRTPSRRFVTALLSIALAAVATSGPAQQAPPPRQPAAAQQQDPPLPARLEQILVEWSQKSAGIRKLQGKHKRWVYDKVFNVEKRAVGRFYYEAPDKGRIDLETSAPEPGEVSRETDPKTGKPYVIQGDRPERWICNGAEIWQINDSEKTVEIITIPQQARGQNIMDGPLPFLFGMPPEKAKQRYWLTLLGENDLEIWLKIKPKWQQDAAQYQEAKVILRKADYLPSAVQLLDPAGNLVTVFTFTDLEPNAINIFFWKDPFRPPLLGYKMVKKSAPQIAPGNEGQAEVRPVGGVEDPPAATTNTADAVLVPSVKNMKYKDIEALLEKAGLTPRFIRGRKTSDDRLKWAAYEQEPQPRTRVKPGSIITITLYDWAGPKTSEKNSSQRQE